MNCDSRFLISCNPVVVRDTSTSKAASHHFSIKDFIKDINVEDMFKMMYKNHFSEPALQAKS